MTTFRHNFVLARSTLSDAPENIVTGHFNLALFAPSWDHRCESIIAADGISIETSIVLRFAAKDDFGFQLRHEAAIDKFLASHSTVVSNIEGDAANLADMWSALWRESTIIADQNEGPLRVLVDLSTCPRFYSLGLIAGMLQFGLAASVTVFYAEGRYNKGGAPLPIDYSFTTGTWSSTPIPFMRGWPDALKRKSYIVSVGFEGAKTARVLAREDPDRIALLFPDPGAQPLYSDETWQRNKEIIDHFRIPEDRVIRAAAGDGIAAWKALTVANLERPDDESNYYLCSGTKPHALGMTLRAICLGYSTVLYNLPERYNFLEVNPSGIFWTYEIRDVTTPVGHTISNE